MCRYFGGCPVLNIPGRTHPVKEYYLEDVLSMTRWGGVATRQWCCTRYLLVPCGSFYSALPCARWKLWCAHL